MSAKNMKCCDPECTNVGAYFFQGDFRTRMYYCSECWGHRYGTETCQVCQKNCYEEDLGTCGRCKRAIDKEDDANEQDIKKAMEGPHEDGRHHAN